MTRGGDGGVTFAFCLGNGGDEGCAGGSVGFVGGVSEMCCCACWIGLTLIAAVLARGWRRVGSARLAYTLVDIVARPNAVDVVVENGGKEEKTGGETVGNEAKVSRKEHVRIT